MDQEKSEALVREMLEQIGEDPTRQGLLDTPKRVVKSWKELYGGYTEDVKQHVRVFESSYDQMVVLGPVEYFSTCEHHMLPFFGKCWIGYIPNKDTGVLGVSKLVRIVNVYARRLQIQEQMTQQIADALETSLSPRGVAVVVSGTHLCMVARGVRQREAVMRTSEMRGAFKESARSRTEALTLMGMHGGPK